MTKEARIRQNSAHSRSLRLELRRRSRIFTTWNLDARIE